jgi:hypothetical protein
MDIQRGFFIVMPLKIHNNSFRFESFPLIMTRAYALRAGTDPGY